MCAIAHAEDYIDAQTQVTLGMMITSTLPWARGLLLFPAQMLGGIVAAALVACLFPGPLAVETKLNADTSIARGVFIEMFLTAELVLTVLFLAAEKSKATFIAPVGIGLALFVAELTGSYSVKSLFLGKKTRADNRLSRCLIYRRFAQPYPVFWPMRGKP